MVAISGDGMPINMGAITQLLQELRIDGAIIAEITAPLDTGRERADYEPAQVPQGRFGTLPNGSALGHHTELARQAVAEALTTMVHDLTHYNESVETFRKGFNVADEHAQQDLDHIAMEIGSVRSASEGGLDR